MATTFVISDLHLGGGYASGSIPAFRMMTQVPMLEAFIRQVAEKPDATLVINGDFVDFLAEEHVGVGDRWRAFLDDPDLARETFQAVVRRDQPVFDALQRLRGRLHILLGNHDVELTLPGVREALQDAVGGAQLRYDGEALVVGDAVIEHGNRADTSNQVDHAALVDVRAALSRGEEPQKPFLAPFGSRFVAKVMNPLKTTWPWIDLFKPEGPALAALILALDPGQKGRILDLLRVATTRKGEPGPVSEGPLFFRGGMSAGGEPPASDDELLAELLAGQVDVPPEAKPRGPLVFRSDMSARGWVDLGALVLLGGDLPTRLRRARPAIQALRRDTTYDPSQENKASYWKAALALARPTTRHPGFRHVLFGHTHLAREVPIEDTVAGRPTRVGTYYNSGTWANLMGFPRELFDPDEGTAKQAYDAFARRLETGDLADLIQFRPTYVRLDTDAQGRNSGQTCLYDGRLV